jgi:hypothetical protein
MFEDLSWCKDLGNLYMAMIHLRRKGGTMVYHQHKSYDTYIYFVRKGGEIFKMTT